MSATNACAADQPTLEETLAWFHKLPVMGGGVNQGLPPDRFKKLTLNDLKSLKEVLMGGHLVDANGKTLPDHLSLPDADYHYLTALPALEVLKFPENNLGDEALKHIGNIKTLKRLVLMENKFTAAGLDHLAENQVPDEPRSPLEQADRRFGHSEPGQAKERSGTDVVSDQGDARGRQEDSGSLA